MTTMGVEEEFLLAHAESGIAAPVAEDVLRVAANDVVRRELRDTQIEVATGICRTATDLEEQLIAGRELVAKAAATAGAVPLATGTPVWPSPPPSASSGRAGAIDERFRGVVDDYEACGCHVHIGVPDREQAVAVLNHLGPWLPSLLALSVNSPFQSGRDTGYGSWRMVQQSRFPGSGVAPHFTDLEAYEGEVSRLVDCGVLIDSQMSFWLARLSGKFPTIEFRAADTAGTVGEALLQALLARALVGTALSEVAAGREAPALSPQIAAAAVWAAARYGLDGRGVDLRSGSPKPAALLVAELLVHVRPALEEHGDLALVKQLVEEVHHHGTGARRQREAGPAGVARLMRVREVTRR
ncbi:carboxylate-amine ligase [Amycolatopsis magusensis]|uniref:Putative glutamate--cysteine ligase 2 n=1 Tax=Amycolatopsis magusensis TaxID=882444 RepID=A0ABS4PQE9_9PSEU|nr:glutamate--cysteine ligase [Amycolatopsis magusensis]MBP2181642.1 carboxylate-amine ligase [Amycolatopsis magusensis]